MNGCCCVEASTLVLMADGSQRPIRDLRIGDLVRTETGTAHIRDIIKGASRSWFEHRASAQGRATVVDGPGKPAP